MTLNELRYVVTLAEEQHFGRAAEKCFVSQPTLSIAIKKLEQELDVSLFERTRNQVCLTPVGEQVAQQARKVLSGALEIKQLATQGQDQLASPLKVGAILTVGPYLFPFCIPQLRAIAPKMPLVIEENYTAVLRKQLRDGALDVIIIALPFSEPDVIVEPLYDERFVVLLPADHPLTAKTEIAPGELANENILFLGDGHCFRDQVLAVDPVIQHSFEHRKEAMLGGEGSSIETLRHMVASGLGITILPASAADLSNYQAGMLEVRPFTAPDPTRTIALAYRASFTRREAVMALKQAALLCPLNKPR